MAPHRRSCATLEPGPAMPSDAASFGVVGEKPCGMLHEAEFRDGHRRQPATVPLEEGHHRFVALLARFVHRGTCRVDVGVGIGAVREQNPRHRYPARYRAGTQRLSPRRHDFFQTADPPGFVGVESHVEQEREHVWPIGRDGMAHEAVAVLEHAVSMVRASQPASPVAMAARAVLAAPRLRSIPAIDLIRRDLSPAAGISAFGSHDVQSAWRRSSRALPDRRRAPAATPSAPARGTPLPSGAPFGR